jgi:hypothetical protein
MSAFHDALRAEAEGNIAQISDAVRRRIPYPSCEAYCLTSGLSRGRRGGQPRRHENHGARRPRDHPRPQAAPDPPCAASATSAPPNRRLEAPVKLDPHYAHLGVCAGSASSVATTTDPEPPPRFAAAGDTSPAAGHDVRPFAGEGGHPATAPRFVPACLVRTEREPPRPHPGGWVPVLCTGSQRRLATSRLRRPLSASRKIPTATNITPTMIATSSGRPSGIRPATSRLPAHRPPACAGSDPPPRRRLEPAYASCQHAASDRQIRLSPLANTFPRRLFHGLTSCRCAAWRGAPGRSRTAG